MVLVKTTGSIYVKRGYSGVPKSGHFWCVLAFARTFSNTTAQYRGRTSSGVVYRR